MAERFAETTWHGTTTVLPVVLSPNGNGVAGSCYSGRATWQLPLLLNLPSPSFSCLPIDFHSPSFPKIIISNLLPNKVVLCSGLKGNAANIYIKVTQHLALLDRCVKCC